MIEPALFVADFNRLFIHLILFGEQLCRKINPATTLITNHPKKDTLYNLFF